MKSGKGWPCFEICLVRGFGVHFCFPLFSFSKLIAFQIQEQSWDMKYISQKNHQLHAPPKRYIFVGSSIPKVSLTSVASLTTGITELERVLLWNVNVVYFLCSSFQLLAWIFRSWSVRIINNGEWIHRKWNSMVHLLSFQGTLSL